MTSPVSEKAAIPPLNITNDTTAHLGTEPKKFNVRELVSQFDDRNTRPRPPIPVSATLATSQAVQFEMQSGIPTNSGSPYLRTDNEVISKPVSPDALCVSAEQQKPGLQTESEIEPGAVLNMSTPEDVKKPKRLSSFRRPDRLKVPSTPARFSKANHDSKFAATDASIGIDTIPPAHLTLSATSAEPATTQEQFHLLLDSNLHSPNPPSRPPPGTPKTSPTKRWEELVASAKKSRDRGNSTGASKIARPVPRATRGPSRPRETHFQTTFPSTRGLMSSDIRN